MAVFMTLEVTRGVGEPTPPQLPDLREWDETSQAIKESLAQALRAEPWGRDLELGREDLGSICLTIRPIEHTAALVYLGQRPVGAPRESTPHLMGACLLLAGLRQADEAALALARRCRVTADEPLFPEGVIEAAATGPRPLLVRLAASVQAEQDVLFQLATRAMADAWFDQFGQSGDPDEPFPPPPSL